MCDRGKMMREVLATGLSSCHDTSIMRQNVEDGGIGHTTEATTTTALRTVEPGGDGATGANLADLGYEPRTELGRLALAVRGEYFAAGGKPFTREEINAEVASRRGGTHVFDDQ